MLTEFNKLYETGEFQLGDCLADVQVKEKGTVDSVRVVRPQNVDKRVESAIVRSMKSRRYTPATHVNVLFPSRCQSASAIAHPERNATAGRIDNEAGRRAHRPLPSHVEERLQGRRGPRCIGHNLRRSAVRTFERASAPRSVAMSLVGHKTESIYRRYPIVDEAMQREAAARLDAWTAAPAPAPSTASVTVLRRRPPAAASRRPAQRALTASG